MWTYFLVGGCCFLLGIGLMWLNIKDEKKKSKTAGTIVIDRSIPEEDPYLFLELQIPIEKLQNEEVISVNVQTRNYLET